MLRLLLFSFFVTVSKLFAQNPIVLINADSVIGYSVNNSPFRDFIGNVHLKQANIDLYCNKAIQDLEANRIILSGTVQIRQDTLILNSDYIEFDANKSLASSPSRIEIKDPQNFLRANYGTYDFKSKVAIFVDSVFYMEKQISIFANKVEYNRNAQVVVCSGNVSLDADSIIMFCDTLIYNKSESKIFASSNVVTKAKYESILTMSGKLFYDRATKYSKSYETPLLLLIDTLKSMNELETIKFDTLFVFADTLISENLENELVFSFNKNIKLFKGELTIVGEFGKIYEKSEWGFLIGKPFLWLDSTEFRGDSLFFHFKNKKIDYFSFVNNASILSPTNIDTNWINIVISDTIRVFFDSNNVDYVLGIGKAKTSYFLEEEESGDIQLANYASDFVKISFVENSIESVIWLGNVAGEVIPRSIFEKNLDKFYIIPKDFLIKKPRLQ